jgi:hypothetical protein
LKKSAEKDRRRKLKEDWLMFASMHWQRTKKMGFGLQRKAEFPVWDCNRRGYQLLFIVLPLKKPMSVALAGHMVNTPVCGALDHVA